MSRSGHGDGGRSPAKVPGSEPPSYSIESIFAVALCAVVIASSVAFLRRARSLSNSLADLQRERTETRPVRVGHGPSAPDARPTLVIVISVDTLRADRLDLNGYERETAPNLRRLGDEGVVFRTVGAQSSQTLTSHKSMFTGKYPATLMLEETGADLLELSDLEGAREYLVNTFSSVHGRLAEGFRERGYRTAAFTDGAWMSRSTGFENGFDLFDDSGGGFAAILPRGLVWLASSASDPAFLFLHGYDVHCPYVSPEPFDSAFCHDHSAHVSLADKCGKGSLYGLDLSAADLTAISDHYDSGVLQADHELGLFLDALRDQGLYDRALIVVTSDHGESLGERGQIGHGGLFVEQLLVPLIVKFPSGWDVTPTVVQDPVELVDLLPTLFTLCGIPTARDLDGSSLLPILFRGVRGKDYLLAQTTFEESPELVSNAAKRSLLRPGRWQVIHDPRTSTASFFSLEHDPAGLIPHSIREEEFPSLLDVLTERASSSPPVLRPRDPVPFSDDLRLELEQLGYAGGPSESAGEPPPGDIR